MIAAFSFGLVLSFVGSVPPGLISASVVQVTLQRGLRAGLALAAGASVVEWVQAFVAAACGRFFAAYPGVDFWFHALALLVFSFLAAYYLFGAKSDLAFEPRDEVHCASDFFRGAGVAALNFLAIPYWVFYTTWLGAGGYLQFTEGLLVVFATGVAFGTFALLWCYARWAAWLQRRGFALLKYTYLAMGWLFAFLSAITLLKIVD